MDTNNWLIIVQFLTAIITLISVYLVYRTIKSNISLNQNNLFNELVKQERELKIKLNEYRLEIDNRIDKEKEFEEITLMYDTLLFNYYEYLAICLYQKLINEKYAKYYFKELLDDVKQLFEDSILFKEQYAQKSQYKGLQWLFDRWKIKR